jgi:hypothetical protein
MGHFRRRSDHRKASAGVKADLFGQFQVGGLHQNSSVRQEHDGCAGVVDFRGIEQLARVGIELEVEPLVRDLVARQEVACLVAERRPAMPDDPNALEGRTVRGAPIVEQIVNDGIEALFGGIPGLEEIIVEADVVDRADGGLCVGIGRQ